MEEDTPVGRKTEREERTAHRAVGDLVCPI